MKIGIFLDIDGVCTQEAANLQYARLLGVEQQELRLERDFNSGKLCTEQFGDRLVRLFRSNNFTHKWAVRNFANIRFKLDYDALLSLFPANDVYIVSSSPSYFIEPLAKKFRIPIEHVLCSQYEFGTKGLILRCADPVSSNTKKNFVKRFRGQYDVAVGVGDVPELDGAFLHLCDFSIVMAHPTEEHLRTEKLIDPIRDFLTNLKRVTELSGPTEIDQMKFAEIREDSQKLGGESDKWKYDRNVLIMTSYRNDERYKKAIQTIRQTLMKHGFKGWLASDRRLCSQLWSNVQAFMLACKYGIAVFTREEERTGARARVTTPHFNPNVSIEVGFMLSRGKDVLILKEKNLKRLPTDMMGSLYQDFDLEDPKNTLPGIIESWIKEITCKKAE